MKPNRNFVVFLPTGWDSRNNRHAIGMKSLVIQGNRISITKISPVCHRSSPDCFPIYVDCFKRNADRRESVNFKHIWELSQFLQNTPIVKDCHKVSPRVYWKFIAIIHGCCRVAALVELSASGVTISLLHLLRIDPTINHHHLLLHLICIITHLNSPRNTFTPFPPAFPGCWPWCG